MAESSKFIIETVANLTGLKQVSKGLELIEKQSRDFSTGLSKDARFMTGSVKQSMNSTGQSMEKATAIFDQSGKRFKVVTGTIAGKTGLMSQGFTDMSKTAKKSIPIVADLTRALSRVLIVVPLWTAFRSIFMGTIRLVKSSVKFLGDWEFQMAQIGIVVNKSASELRGLSSELLTLSRNLGVSNKEIGEGAKLFSQQGRAMEEILPLMNATSKLSLLTGRSITQSVEDLTAVLKAYKIEARDAITIVDGITNVMLNNAITAGDLASAYKQVASTASIFGVSLNALTGYITAVKTVTRDSGSKIGLTFRTLFTRLTTTSAKAIQDLTGIPLFLDKTSKATKTLTPNLRNLETVIGELASSFKELGTAQQSQLAKLLGGVRRTNQVIALFQNFDQATKANIESLFNFGKAGQAVNILTDTLNLRVKRLAGTWNEFTDAVGDTAPLKSFISGLTGVLKTLTLLSNPNQFQRITLLEELNEQQDAFIRDISLAKGFIEAEKRAKSLQESLEAGRTTSAEVELEIGLWSINLAKASRILGVDFNANLTSASDLVKELNDRFEDISLAKAKLEIQSLAKESQKDLVNLSADLRKIGDKLLSLRIGRQDLSPTRIDRGAVNNALEITSEIREIFNNLERDFDLKVFQKLISLFNELGVAGTEEGSKLIIQFGKIAKEFDNTGKSISKLGELTEGFTEKFKKAREEAKKTRLKIAETEATVLEKLFQIELDSIKLNKDNLEVVREKLSLLKSNDDVNSARLTQLRETLEKEEAKLKVAKERFKIDLRNQTILNKSKNLGASELQLAIQELAIAEATKIKSEERLKLQQKIVDLMQKEEIGAQKSILSAVEAVRRASGEQTSESLLRTKDIEKRLGLEKQGLDSLNQQLELAKAIVKEGGDLEKDSRLDLTTKKLIKLLGDNDLNNANIARSIESITDDFTSDSKRMDYEKFQSSLKGVELTPDKFQSSLGTATYNGTYEGSKKGILDALKQVGSSSLTEGLSPNKKRLNYVTLNGQPIQNIQVQPGTGTLNGQPIQNTQIQPGTGTLNGLPIQNTQIQPGTGTLNGQPIQNIQVQPGTIEITITKVTAEEIDSQLATVHAKQRAEIAKDAKTPGTPLYEAIKTDFERL